MTALGIDSSWGGEAAILGVPMARPKSDEKRVAILEAAIRAVAAEGARASTAAIARAAGVAEGTLFTYFASKDVLLNEVYLAVKGELRATLLGGFPERGTAKARSQHIWRRYIAWGAAHPESRKAMSQLSVSEIISAETRQKASVGFEVFGDLIREWSGLCHAGCKATEEGAFAAAVLSAIADTTLDFIAREPKAAEVFTTAGFEAFWRAARAK